MKIKKNELPKTNFSQQNILCSLAKAINNGREGNYLDCGFLDEASFYDFLFALEKAAVIIKKPSKKKSKTVDLSNYICVEYPDIRFEKRNAFCRWLQENVVPLLTIAANAIQLFK